MGARSASGRGRLRARGEEQGHRHRTAGVGAVGGLLAQVLARARRGQVHSKGSPGVRGWGPVQMERLERGVGAWSARTGGRISGGRRPGSEAPPLRGRCSLAGQGGLTEFQVHLYGRCLVGVVLLLELDGAEVAEPFLDAAGVVEPVDVLEEGSPRGRCRTSPRPSPWKPELPLATGVL